MLSALHAECQSVINNPFMLEVVREVVITFTVVMLSPVAPLETPKIVIWNQCYKIFWSLIYILCNKLGHLSSYGNFHPSLIFES